MSNVIETADVPAYACHVTGTLDDAFRHMPDSIQLMREQSCQTCGYPNHHAGPLCQTCAEYDARKIAALGQALADHFDPRNVHVHGRGTIYYTDPDYKNYIE